MRGNSSENLVLTASIRDIDFEFITPKGLSKPLPQGTSQTSQPPTPLTLTNESVSDSQTISNLPSSKLTYKNYSKLEKKPSGDNFPCRGRIGSVRNEGLPREITFDEWNNICTDHSTSVMKTSSLA
jgi:hypothetical protein